MRKTVSIITGQLIEIEDCNLELDKFELSWCAGFFDGEGCTYFGKRQKHVIDFNLSMAQADKRVLIRFRRATKNRMTLHGPFASSKLGKDHWQLRASGFENAQFIMCLIWNYLSPAKREQYKIKVGQYLEAKGMKIHLVK